MSDPIVVVDEPQNIVVVQPIVPTIQITAPGPQGGAAQVFYTHTQNTPSAAWVINHNLNGHPTAVVLDSAGTMCEGAFEYPSTNQMIIRFNSAFSGIAYII